MRLLFLILVAVVGFCSLARAQTQTINTNQGIPCNAISSQGPVTFCRPGISYGCNSSATSSQILGTDGNRSTILIQDTGSSPLTVTFGDSAVLGGNGFIVQPGNNFAWNNPPLGNAVSRIVTNSISIISTGATSCVFMYAD